MASSNDTLPDKEYLYGEFQRRQRWRDRLAQKLAYKAVDIPEDEDVNVNVQNGIGWKGMAVIAGALLGGGWLVAAALQSPTSPPAPMSPADSEYEVRFYDSQGRLIEIPRLPERSQSHETKT